MTTFVLAAGIVLALWSYVWLGRAIWHHVNLVDMIVNPREAAACPTNDADSVLSKAAAIVFVAAWPVWLVVGAIRNRMSHAR